MESSPFDTPFLFRHIFDIDDIIAALCADGPRVLDTRNGHILTPKTPQNAAPSATFAPQSGTHVAANGADTAPVAAPAAPIAALAPHLFPLEPLPHGFMHSLATSPERRLLNADDQTVLADLLTTLTPTDLPHHFPLHGRVGGWLRERVKDAALEWLDLHDLIPPSMRHINRRTDMAGPRKIVID